MIDISEVSWINFLGYANYTSKIVFDDIKGVCLIEGEHAENESREEGDEKLNASGKTSIIEAITWGLFGNSTRKQNPGDIVINWNTGKNCKVNIKTRDGYEIVRMRKYDGLTEVLLLKDGEDITESTAAPTQDKINEIFKINYNAFTRSRIFGQFSLGFLEDTEAKRRKVFEYAMHIDNLLPMVETTKDKIKGVDKDINKIDAKIEGIDSELDHILKHLDSLEEKSSNFSDEITQEITEIKSELSKEILGLNGRITSIETEISGKEKETRKTIDIKSLKSEWNDYNSNLDSYNNKIESINKIKEKISELKSDINLEKQSLSYCDLNVEPIDVAKCKLDQENHDTFVDKHSNSIKLQNQLNLGLERIDVLMKQEQDFIDHDHEIGSTCSECHNEITGEQLEVKKTESKQKLDELHKKTTGINSKLSKIVLVMEDLEVKMKQDFMSVDAAIEANSKIDDDHKSAETHNNKIEELSKKVDKLSSAVVDVERPVSPDTSISEAETNNEYIKNIDESINNDMQRIKDIKLDARARAEKAKKAIANSKNKSNPYISLIQEQSKLSRDLEEEKQVMVKQQNEKKTLKTHLDYIRESYSNKRKIKAFWISKLIPDFNKYLKYYLDFFETNDKIEFDELLNPKLDKWPYETHSGGECKKIDLSIMFALSDLQVSNFGPQSNFIILDEVDGRLDPFTMNKLTSLLSDDLMNRNDGLSNIFMISHRKEMKDRFPHKIKVKNKQGNAYIINNG